MTEEGIIYELVVFAMGSGTGGAAARWVWKNYSNQVDLRITALEQHITSLKASRLECQVRASSIQKEKDEMSKDVLITMHDTLNFFDSISGVVTKEHADTRDHITTHTEEIINKIKEQNNL